MINEIPELEVSSQRPAWLCGESTILSLPSLQVKSAGLKSGMSFTDSSTSLSSMETNKGLYRPTQRALLTSHRILWQWADKPFFLKEFEGKDRNNATSTWCFIGLERVGEVELHTKSKAKFFFTNLLSSSASGGITPKKLVLFERNNPEVKVTLRCNASNSQFAGNASSAATNTGNSSSLVDVLYSSLRKALLDGSWRQPSSPSPAPVLETAAGVGRIVRRQNDQIVNTQQQIESALIDLESLKHQGHLMAQVATQLKHRLVTAFEESSPENVEVYKLLASYGLADGTVQSSASRASVSQDTYYIHLARDLLIFLLKVLAPKDLEYSLSSKACPSFDETSDSTSRPSSPGTVCSGMILLHDLYCLFNRIRGTDLVSPNDLLVAINMLTNRNDPLLASPSFLPDFCTSMPILILRRYSQGQILAVQLLPSDGSSDAEDGDTIIARTICRLIQQKHQKLVKENQVNVQEEFHKHSSVLGTDVVCADCGISTFEVAASLGVSISLAQIQLQMAEEMGFLCRDEHIEGTTFYINFFDNY